MFYLHIIFIFDSFTVYSSDSYYKLENGRSTPGCLTVQCNMTVSTKKTRRTLVT